VPAWMPSALGGQMGWYYYTAEPDPGGLKREIGRRRSDTSLSLPAASQRQYRDIVSRMLVGAGGLHTNVAWHRVPGRSRIGLFSVAKEMVPTARSSVDTASRQWVTSQCISGHVPGIQFIHQNCSANARP
jgi:hypothetical protein